MGPVSKLPLGLLDLFGLKTMGDYPRVVADQIAPTLDVEKYLHLANSEFALANVQFAAGVHSITAGTLNYQATAQQVTVGGRVGSLDVNAREMWQLIDWSITGQTNEVGIAIPLPTLTINYPNDYAYVPVAQNYKRDTTWTSAFADEAKTLVIGGPQLLLPGGSMNLLLGGPSFTITGANYLIYYVALRFNRIVL